MKKIYFDQILKGTKKNEIRELRHNSANRYLHTFVNSEGQSITEPKEFDLLRLYMGYQKNRPHFDIKVKGAKIYTFTDDDGNESTYVVDGVEYLHAEIEYNLGEIVATHNCKVT
jgi:hypothetical protein